LVEVKVKRLRENIPLLNKVGMLLREEPTLGRVIAMKKHVYVDGIIVYQLVEDLGYLILATVSKACIAVDDASLAVERSNYMKQRARIIDGSNTRIERHGGRTSSYLSRAHSVLCRSISFVERVGKL